jgi:hypothetical protein
MPHIVVKLLPGRTEQQKAQLAAAIKVYRPEILPNRHKLYKNPGYDRPQGRT